MPTNPHTPYDPDYGLASERVRPDLWPASGLPVREQVTTNGIKFLVDGDYDGEYFAQFRWFAQLRTTHPYIYRNPYPKTKPIYLAREVLGRPPHEHLMADYINGNHLDLRSANLRWFSRSQHAAKRPIGTGRKGKGATSSYVGVTLHSYYAMGGRLRKPWMAACGSQTLGYFATAEEAARARDVVAWKLYGPAAQLNFPHDYL